MAGREVAPGAGRVHLPKNGPLRIAGACPAQAELRRLLRRGRARLTSATASRRGDGSRWLSVKGERRLDTDPAHCHPGRPVVGVDRGVKTAAVAATATGGPLDHLAAGRRRRADDRRVAPAQREASPRWRRNRPPPEQAADWRRSQAKVGRLHVRIARQRANDLHSFTRRPAGEHPVIILETLTTKNLMADRRIAAAIADQGWGEPARQLTYKTAWAGGTLLAAPCFLPSSNACTTYGRAKPKLGLGERTYRCGTCGHVADRTSTHSLLAARGEHRAGGCRCVIRGRNRDPRGRTGSSGFQACGGWVTAGSAATPPTAVPSGDTRTSRQPTAA